MGNLAIGVKYYCYCTSGKGKEFSREHRREKSETLQPGALRLVIKNNIVMKINHTHLLVLVISHSVDNEPEINYYIAYLIKYSETNIRQEG